MTADNPRQVRTLAALGQKIQDQTATNDDIMGRAEAGRLDSARTEFAERVKIRQIDQIRALEKAIRDEEVRLLDVRQTLEAGRRTQISLILAATGVL